MTPASVEATDAPVVETGASVAWTGGAVVKTDTRVVNARAVDAETGARVATTAPSDGDDGSVGRNDLTGKIENRQPEVPKKGSCPA